MCNEEYDKALADAEAAVATNKEESRGYYRKAQILQHADKALEALEVLVKAPDKIRKNEAVVLLMSELQAELKADNLLPKDHPEIISFNNLAKWLADGGAKFDKLKMRYYSEGYRGVHARGKIKKGEIFLFVPKNLLITLEMAKEAPIGIKMLQAKLNLLSPKHCYLSSYILQERHKKDSKWRPYLDILPGDLSTFPVFFAFDEKKWLQGSSFLVQVEDKVEDMRKDYEAIVDVAPEFAQHSLEEFKRVRTLVSSRIFGVKINGSKTDVLVPLADMLNHKRPQETLWEYNEARGGFTIEAKIEIERGEQVYDSYGRKCNSRYFLNYGFVVEDNDANEVPITISLREDDPLYSVKADILKNCRSKTIRVTEDLTEKNMIHFFSFLRFVSFKGDPMVLYKFQIQEGSLKRTDEDNEENYFRCSNVPPISAENEMMVLVQIKEQCSFQLKGYPTTYEEDLKILQTHKDLTYNQRNCVMMRSGEKKILIFLQRLAELGLELLAMPYKKAKEVLKKDQDGNKYEKYMNTLLGLIQTAK